MKHYKLPIFGVILLFILSYCYFEWDNTEKKIDLATYSVDAKVSDKMKLDKSEEYYFSTESNIISMHEREEKIRTSELSIRKVEMKPPPEDGMKKVAGSIANLFSLSPVMDGSTLNTENIPDIFVDNASRFSANLSVLHDYSTNSIVAIEIFGETYEAKVSRHKALDHNIKNTRLEFGYSNPPQYLTLFSYSDGRVKGRIYTEKGNYVFLHNGKTGFLIEMNKLRELEGSPITE